MPGYHSSEERRFGWIRGFLGWCAQWVLYRDGHIDVDCYVAIDVDGVVCTCARMRGVKTKCTPFGVRVTGEMV